MGSRVAEVRTGFLAQLRSLIGPSLMNILAGVTIHNSSADAPLLSDNRAADLLSPDTRVSLQIISLVISDDCVHYRTVTFVKVLDIHRARGYDGGVRLLLDNDMTNCPCYKEACSTACVYSLWFNEAMRLNQRNDEAYTLDADVWRQRWLWRCFPCNLLAQSLPSG